MGLENIAVTYEEWASRYEKLVSNIESVVRGYASLPTCAKLQLLLTLLDIAKSYLDGWARWIRDSPDGKHIFQAFVEEFSQNIDNMIRTILTFLRDMVSNDVDVCRRIARLVMEQKYVKYVEILKMLEKPQPSSCECRHI